MTIRQAKKSFFKEKINENKNNPKRLWTLINDLSRSSQNNECIQQIVDENGNVVKGKSDVAELFNHFFINKPISLLKQSMTIFNESLLTDFLQNMMPFETSFQLPLITASMVQSQLQKIPKLICRMI